MPDRQIQDTCSREIGWQVGSRRCHISQMQPDRARTLCPPREGAGERPELLVRRDPLFASRSILTEAVSRRRPPESGQSGIDPIADMRLKANTCDMRLAYAAAALFSIGGCSGLTGSISRDEVFSVTSPDGNIRASLFETNGGATVSYGYEIELVHTRLSGERPVKAGTLYGAIRSSCSYGANLRWLSPDQIEVEFLKADKMALPNTVRVGGKTVHMIAREGVSDDNAPCGGMFASKG